MYVILLPLFLRGYHLAEMFQNLWHEAIIFKCLSYSSLFVVVFSSADSHLKLLDRFMSCQVLLRQLLS